MRKASDLKTRFLSNMSHEFRTPLNSVVALSRLLLDRIDGELTAEQERQVGYIRRSAEGLLELVNDMLDLAKVEAGKIDVKAAEFDVTHLFGGLRGALKPLLTNPSVELIFESPAEELILYTDEAKISQILRNLISNALKFTEKGVVGVEAEYDPHERRVHFYVKDTGIGIAAADQGRIFEEFTQLETKLHGRVKGTGLGLSLSRSLAEVLGGTLTVRSELGKGSVFTLSVPASTGDSNKQPAGENLEQPQKRILLVDDDETFRYVFRQIISGEPRYHLLEAKDGEEGLMMARTQAPDVIILDLQMPTIDGFTVLQELGVEFANEHDSCRCFDLAYGQRGAEGQTPVENQSNFQGHNLARERLLISQGSDPDPEGLMTQVPKATVLNVDDEEAPRYLKTRDLKLSGFTVIEADCGAEALRVIDAERPPIVLLDVQLPDMKGTEVCALVKKRWPEVMVLMTSATFTTAEHRTFGLDSGADSYLLQPAERLELAAAINSLLRIRRVEDDLRSLNATLEKKVNERTSELLSTNARLRAEIAQRQKAEKALVQAQKMEAVGQLTGELAHDFNNLLTAVIGNLELIKAKAGDARIAKLAENGVTAANRGAKLTSQLLAFSRTQKLAVTSVDVNALIEGMHPLLNQTLGPNIEIRQNLDENLLTATADANQLELAILNLCINARDAMPDGGSITLSSFRDPQDERAVIVSVADTGCGMTPEVASRAFDPFFTTKPAGKGTGLGLLAGVRDRSPIGRRRFHRKRSRQRNRGSDFAAPLRMRNLRQPPMLRLTSPCRIRSAS